MERKKVSFSAKIEPVEKLNDEFLKCKVYVCALGKNRNLSHISRDAADEALYSLYNIPVIGHLYEDADGKLHMGGHDMKIEQDEDGNLIYRSVCVPFGTVPNQDNVHYEDIKEPNGDIKTYVVADCILWVGRFPELLDAAYSDDWLFSESMEINVQDYAPLEDDKNYADILHYTYSALCLLGRSDNEEYNTEPCFPGSHVAVSYEYLTDQRFVSLMEELKKDLSECFSDKTDGKEGEVNMKDEIRDAILAEYNVPLEELTFEIGEDMTEEDFKEKLEAFVQARSQNAGKPEGEPEGEPAAAEEPRVFTFRERAEALANAMPNSSNVYYYVCDFDDKYAYVEICSWNDSGNYAEETGRLEYSYDEAEKKATIVSEFEPMVVRWLTETENEQINALRGQYEELKAYKESREQQDREAALDAALEPFADLVGNEEFDAITVNKYSYKSVEDLQNACFIIRGKYGLIQKPHKNNEPSVPVGAPRETIPLRERFHEEYSRRANKT